MKARKGKQLPTGVTILPRTTSVAINQMRCSKCNNMAVAQNGAAAGQTVYKCPTCGSGFVSQSLSAASPKRPPARPRA